MKWKTTLVLFLTTVGIGAYISLVDLRQSSPEQREAASKQLVRLADPEIAQLNLEFPKGRATLARHDTGWRLMPQGVRADAELAERLVDELTSLIAERALSSPGGQGAFGLDPAVGTITVTAGPQSVTIRLGDTTATAGNRYAAVTGRPEVFVVPSALFDAADQPPERFRDPLLFRTDARSAAEISLAAPAPRFTLRRGAEREWRLEAPLADLADPTAVEGWLDRLGGLRIQRFLNDTPQVEQLAVWGFDPPAAELTVSHEGQPPVTVFFGRPLPDDASLVHAKRSDEPPLYAVAAHDLEPLLKDANDLRQTACFQLAPRLVARLELRDGERRLVLVRGDGGWTVEGQDAVLNAGRMQVLLEQVSLLRTVSFLDAGAADPAAAGLAPPIASITVGTSDGREPQQLAIGHPIGHSPNRYGRIERRQAVVELPETVTALLATTPDVLATALPPPPPEPAHDEDDEHGHGFGEEDGGH